MQSLLGHNDIQTTMDIYTHLEHRSMAQRAGGFAARVNATERGSKKEELKESKGDAPASNDAKKATETAKII
jgi:hypothetical protein